MKTWLVILLTVEAVLITCLIGVLIYLGTLSPKFAEAAASTTSHNLRGVASPINVALYFFAAAILLPLGMAYQHNRKNRY